MTKSHITKQGEARPCTATERACPLGEHYDSMREAVFAKVDQWDANLKADLRARGLPEDHYLTQAGWASEQADYRRRLTTPLVPGGQA